MACACCGDCPNPYPNELRIHFGQQTYSRPDNCIVAQQTTNLFSNATYVLARPAGQTSCTQATFFFTSQALISVTVTGDFVTDIQITSRVSSASGCPGGPPNFAETYGFFRGQQFYNVRTNVNINPQRYPFYANLLVDSFPFFTFSR